VQIQEFGSLAQAWNIGLETGPRCILVGDFIQTADTVDDSRHPSEQNRDEAGHRAENKGWRGCLQAHVSAASTSGGGLTFAPARYFSRKAWRRRVFTAGQGPESCRRCTRLPIGQICGGK